MSRTIKVGIFVVGGIALFSTGLFLIGSREQLFAHHFVVYAQFNDINTLQTGAKVRVSGMNAGQITGIDVPKAPSSKFRLQLKVDQKFHPIIRKDSVASIETEGMVGNKFINIAKGSANSPECPPGCTLPSQEAVSMAQLMREASGIAKDVHSTIKRADQAVDNITSASGNVDKLITSVSPKVEKIASNSVSISNNANAITADIRHGHGTAGKLLTDDKVASNVATTIANAKQTSANLDQASRKVNAVADNAQKMSQQLNQAVGTFLAPGNHNESTAAALRDAAHGAKQTATNLADDTDAIKTNFFLRGFFNRRGFFDLTTVTPSKYAASRFVKSPRARVWIAATELFKVGPDGSQQLSDEGRSVLDRYMSELTPYLPNNPIVVEGYSTQGMPDQQYLVSRQRAVEVRQYLGSRFHLQSERVGIMPLSDHPPLGTGKQTWDGVCLVLVVSKR